jgi:hypothetical protein
MPPSILKTTSGGTLDDQAVNPTMSEKSTVTAGKVSAMAPLPSLASMVDRRVTARTCCCSIPTNF